MIMPDATLPPIPAVSGHQESEKLAFVGFIASMADLSCDPRKYLDRPQAMAFYASNVDRHQFFIGRITRYNRCRLIQLVRLLPAHHLP